jgi:hypothetical protein
MSLGCQNWPNSGSVCPQFFGKFGVTVQMRAGTPIASGGSPFEAGCNMEKSLTETPGFIYAKELSTVFVVNKHGEPIVFTEDRAEMEWLFDWIVGSERHHLRALPVVQQSPVEDDVAEPLTTGSSTQHLAIASKPVERIKQPPITRRKFDRRPAHTRGGARRQLIGEQIGQTRILQLRVFQTQQEAEKWAREGDDRRFRFATIGSVGWTRALDEEMKVVQHTQCAPLLSNESR